MAAGKQPGGHNCRNQGEIMKFTKILGLVAMAALALMAFASTASATTLYTNGVKQTGAVTIHATLEGSAVLKDTSNTFANTCTESTVEGTTTSFTGTTVGGPINTLTFSKCTHEKVVVDEAGSLTVERIGTTDNGTVRSTGAKVTVPVTILGSVVTATCTTSNTDIGTLTGSTTTTYTAPGQSDMDINAVLNCGSILPSAKWEGTYRITGHNLAVGA
jgi:uncharacterized protein (DUF2141 family)